VKAKTRLGAGGDVTEVALAQGAGTLSLQPAAAAELIAFLKTPAARAAMQRRGMEPVANGE
jgi:hypothetical protein